MELSFAYTLDNCLANWFYLDYWPLVTTNKLNCFYFPNLVLTTENQKLVKTFIHWHLLSGHKSFLKLGNTSRKALLRKFPNYSSIALVIEQAGIKGLLMFNLFTSES